MAEFAAQFDRRLDGVLNVRAGVDARLAEAMRYSLLAPGKRLRPYLVDCCVRIVGGASDVGFPCGAAVEMVHAFSLIHDDLPAMDDDDLRRGRPTNHRVYGEALAILAGDALLALAFETLAADPTDATRTARLVMELARATGWQGMIAGQAADLAGESMPPEEACVRGIHERKTAALIAGACRMGAIAGGGDESAITGLGEYGRQLGLAFQIADDLLDVTASADLLGKAVGKDAARRKQTYPASVGMERSRALASAAVARAIKALAPFGEAAKELRELAGFVVQRRA
jgi:geranylgeranyl diphosphate synthase type II